MKQKLKKHRKKIVVIAIVLVIIIAAVVIVGKVKSGQTKKGKQEIQKENTVSLEKMDLTKSISATGTIESKESREVSANVNGVTIKKVNVSVGDEVKKGKSLITFDETDLQESLSEAKDSLSDAQSEGASSIEKAQKQVSDAKSEYADVKSEENSKTAKAKKAYEEAKKSKQKEQISQAKTEYENAVSTRKSTLKQSKSSIEQAQEALETAKSSAKKSIKEAKKAGVTTGALYGYYDSKEDLFEALVGEHYNFLLERFCKAQKEFAEIPPEEQPNNLTSTSGECMYEMLLYAYEHLNEFKLILCCSEGTRFSKLIDEMVEIETKGTHDYLAVLEKIGRPAPPIDERLEHILITGMFNTFFELIIHEMPLEEAKHYLKEMRDFYTAGWMKIMGQ